MSTSILRPLAPARPLRSGAIPFGWAVALPASFPQDHVLGVIGLPEGAERAARALRAAGIDAADLRLIPSGEARLVRAILAERHPFLHRLHTWLLSSDAGNPVEAYLRAARRGGDILAVRVRDRAQIGRSAGILARHHAYMVRHITAWSTTRLTPA